MAIYKVCPVSGAVRAAFMQSPSIALETDLPSLEQVPEAVRSAADSFWPGKTAAFERGEIPQGSNGAITWFADDQLLQGSAAAIRRDVRIQGRRCFVPVHFKFLPGLDLIGVQPRWITAGWKQDYWDPSVRILSSSLHSPRAQSALQSLNEAWALISLAFYSEGATPGSGIEMLNRLMNSSGAPSVVAALALRNLAVLLIRHNELQKAEQLLELGAKTYPGYAELSYVAAILCFRQQKPSRAVALLKQECPVNRALVGSGGEDSYRRGWLMGMLAAGAGNQEMAFEQFRIGMTNSPAFAPAIDELLKLRCSPAHIVKHQWEFCRLARREPQYLDPVVNYLLLHRAFAAVRRIAETVPMPEDKRAVLLDRVESAATPFRPGTGPQTRTPGVMLCGPFFEHSGIARVNRELGISLMESSGLDASLEPTTHSKMPDRMVQKGETMLKGLLRHPAHLDLTIRNQWPPDFSRPPRGKLALILSWGYRAVPLSWLESIENKVDELWVPSHSVRDAFAGCGVSTHRIQVVPQGIDVGTFAPEGPASRPNGCRKFIFLFKGKLAPVAGVDLVLRAFRATFNAGDDVTLVLSARSENFHHDNMIDGLLQTCLSDPACPHILVVPDAHDDRTLAAMYRGSGAFVFPYRASAFPMQVLEAMACGRPVITTAEGPSRDFCGGETTCLVPANESEALFEVPPVGELAGRQTWFEPDISELAQAMRRVYQNPVEFASRGRAAAEAVRQTHHWDRLTEMYRRRIHHLMSISGIPKPATVPLPAGQQ